MKKTTKILLLVVIVLSLVFLFTKGVSYAKYASNSVWNYYLESKNFYFSSDYLSVNNIVNVNNNWDLSNIEFNLKNYENNNFATEYDINYNVVCTTDNTDVKCNLNDTLKDVYTGVISSEHRCINNIDTTNVSGYDKTNCELNGYEWKSVNSSKTLYFNLSSDKEYESVNVTIKVTSTSPFKKVLIGTFEIKKDKSINGVISSNYKNYSNYDRLVLTNTYNEEKCVLVSFNSNNLRIDTPLINVLEYTKDENGYIDSVVTKINSKENVVFKFYKLDSNIYKIDDFTIIESVC